MRHKQKFCRNESGMSLIELMMALVVLLVGVLGSLILLTVGIASNFRNRQDSNSAVMAQMVVEKIRSGGSSVAAMNLDDCASNPHAISTSGSASGTGAQLLSSGTADFTQTAGSAGNPAGYYMLSSRKRALSWTSFLETSTRSAFPTRD